MNTPMPAGAGAPIMTTDAAMDATPVTRRIERHIAEIRGQSVHRIVLANRRGMEVSVLTYGGIIQHIKVPDRDGLVANVVLGFEAIEDYFSDRSYLGAVVGRYANRIGGARFQLDGRTYQLERNDGDHHLHGGANGFHARVWTMAGPRNDDGGDVCLTMHSPDGDGGYPGALAASVTYTLTPDNALSVDYAATTDHVTPFSPSQHSYFNLAGVPHDVLGHYLTIAASHITPVTDELIPLGVLQPVAHSAFDFRTPQRIGARITSSELQIRRGNGYDHNFALDVVDGHQPRLAARLHDPGSGRILEISTTAPGLQLYTGNVLDVGMNGAEHVIYQRHAGVALETQHFPDAPNQPTFPSSLLRPGERFASRTIFQFSVDAHDFGEPARLPDA